VFYSPPHIPGGFQWNVKELQIKEYESRNSGNTGWIPSIIYHFYSI
jgi:hypothetical protein